MIWPACSHWPLYGLQSLTMIAATDQRGTKEYNKKEDKRYHKNIVECVANQIFNICIIQPTLLLHSWDFRSIKEFAVAMFGESLHIRGGWALPRQKWLMTFMSPLTPKYVLETQTVIGRFYWRVPFHHKNMFQYQSRGLAIQHCTLIKQVIVIQLPLTMLVYIHTRPPLSDPVATVSLQSRRPEQ